MNILYTVYLFVPFVCPFGHWEAFGYYEPSHIFKLLLFTFSLSSVCLCTTILSNQPQPSLPWSFHPFLLTSSSRRALHRRPPIPTFHLTELGIHLCSSTEAAFLKVTRCQVQDHLLRHFFICGSLLFLLQAPMVLPLLSFSTSFLPFTNGSMVSPFK